MAIVRDQMAQNQVQSENEDEESAVLRDTDPNSGAYTADEESLLLPAGTDEDDSLDDLEVRIGGKLLRELKVAELKSELSRRLPEEEIPSKWPRKNELVQMLESTIREFTTEQPEELKDGHAEDETEADAAIQSADDTRYDISEDDDQDESDEEEELVLKLRGKPIKNLSVSELKQELQARLDDSDIQDLSKPKWPRKAELVHRLQTELRKEQQSRRTKNKLGTSRPPTHQIEKGVESEQDDEEPNVFETGVSTACDGGGGDLFAQAAAEYAQQNPQEAHLAAKKSSPFDTKSKQYISRRKKQQHEEGTTDTSDSRPMKQPANTGNMSALLGDLSETEAVGRRRKRELINDSAAQASAAMSEDDDAPLTTESVAGRKDTKKKAKPVSDPKDTKKKKGGATIGVFEDVFAGESEEFDDQDTAPAQKQKKMKVKPVSDPKDTKKKKGGATKGVFEDVFAGESEESDDQDTAPAQKKKKSGKSSPFDIPPATRRQQSTRLAAAAATAAAAAVVTAEIDSSSEEDDDAEEQPPNTEEPTNNANDPMQSLEVEDDDEVDDDSSNDDEETAGELQRGVSSIIQDILDEDGSQEDPDDEEHDVGHHEVHNKVIFRNVNGLLLNQFQIPSPGISPMQNTQKKLSFLEGSDEESLSESEEEDSEHISGVVNFDEVIYPDSHDDSVGFPDFSDDEEDGGDFMDDAPNRHSTGTSMSIESQILVRSIQAKIKSVGKMRRKGQKQEALRQSRNAQSQLSSVVAKESAKVDKLRRLSLAPIHKGLKKRATAIKRAKEYLAQEYALCVSTHQAELKRLDAINNAARACAQDIEATRLESQSALKEKHDAFMSTYISQNEGFVGKVKELGKKDPRQEHIAKMMEALNGI